MKNRHETQIEKALKSVRKSSPQFFAVGTYFSESLNEGVIFVNLQRINGQQFAVWFVGTEGNRFAGGYYDDYNDAVTDYNNRFQKILDQENA